MQSYHTKVFINGYATFLLHMVHFAEIVEQKRKQQYRPYIAEWFF